MRHKSCLLAIFTSLLISLLVPHKSIAEDGFASMFNGVDLTGWVLTNTPPETWSFEDGMLVCSGKPIGELRTAKMYQNFVMELEWRHMVPRGNAGVFVWADDITARGVPFHRGIEVQVLEDAYGNSERHTTHGDIFPIHGATMTPINGRGGSRAFPTENRSKPSPQWNHYRIECRDGEISLAVNGKVVTQGKDCVPRKGYICLESEGGVVHYRNVKIRELPASDITPQQVAISDRGYRSLYTGLNLHGWQALSSAEQSRWKSKNWVLAYEGSKNQTDSLSSIDALETGEFVVDIRLKDSASNVVIQVGDGGGVDLRATDFASHLEPVGRWNRIERSLREGTYTWTINGHRVPVETRDASKTGKLVLQPTGPVDFCNLYAGSTERQ
jgi:hypothetical protein